MSTEISSKATIAKNTTLLYGRTVLIMLVSLYTSRVILQALGVEDYGVYTAIGGIVSILSVVIGPIDSSISRFLTYELGHGDKDMLRRYFGTGLTIMIIFSIIAVVILETAGLWFLNNKMVIDEDRITAANWVLHLSIASFVVNMISAPYRASIIAHERMSLFAYMGILDAALKLGVALMIKYSSSDKLILYTLLLLIVGVLIQFIYTVVCNRQFEECYKPKFKIDKDLFGGLFTFAGWNIFGAGAMVCRNQGINILFNLFGGPIVNAAFGIANQVNSAVGSFVGNFTTAINPSIIKSYASRQKDYMLSLVYQGAKFSYFLVFLFALPILLEAEYITKLWLGQTPAYSVQFIQLMLLHSMVESLSKTIMAGTHASGNIRIYQIVVGGFQILILPVTYLLLCMGFSPSYALLATVVIDIIALFARMIIARGIFSLSFWQFSKNVIVVVIFTSLAATPVPLLLRVTLNESFWRVMIVGVVSVITISLSVLYLGCTQTERASILSKSSQLIKRVTHR